MVLATTILPPGGWGEEPLGDSRFGEKGAWYGEVSSAWANRVQPANSKGGNWWQSRFAARTPGGIFERVWSVPGDRK